MLHHVEHGGGYVDKLNELLQAIDMRRRNIHHLLSELESFNFSKEFRRFIRFQAVTMPIRHCSGVF
jgi:hypothetical protein